MKKLRLSPVVLGFLIMGLCMGCIKENRSECPCTMVLDFSEVDRDRSDSLSLGIIAMGGFLHTAIIPSSEYGDLYRVEVPKGDVWVNVYSMDSWSEEISSALGEDYSSMNIPYGEECPEVRSFSLHKVLAAETVTVPVTLHKNYCRLSITMVYEGELPMQISILGDICGYDREGIPVSGAFLYEPTGSGGLFYACIPRQNDSSLRLDLSDEEEILREFAIGEYILESGYDWSAEDLDDVWIEVDYTKTHVTITVGDWTTVVEIETVI
ncbi:MAG: hypothetical protein LUD72_02275 [Bacteroidales bacterium]|nr:hypothetical protein [Bacteroidales bacterium]